jgi:flagellar protein FliS
MQNASYLESKVLTAPPQRLHLMLVEGALRFGRQADEALRHGDQVAAALPLLRVIDIVGELVAGVRETKSELNNRLADLYLFIFRRVSQAKINGDAASLADALKLLEYERQTWQLVCDKLAGSENPPAKPPQPHAAAFHSTQPANAGRGLSLEA